MVKLELLSVNLVSVIKEMVKNQDLVKLIAYNATDPIAEADITNPLDYLLNQTKRVAPQMFDPDVTTEDSTNVRVYFLDGELEKNVEEAVILFDVIVAKDLWLIYENGEIAVRAYRIMSEIARCFEDVSIDKIGVLKFIGFKHMVVPATKFHGVRLFAKITGYSR